MKNINPKYVKLLQKSYEKYQHIDTVTTGNVVADNSDIKAKINKIEQNLESDLKPSNLQTVIKSEDEKSIKIKKHGKENKNSSLKRKSPKSHNLKCFSPEEDKVLLNAIKSGTELNFTKIAKAMKRDRSSVRDRIDSLKRKKTNSSQRRNNKAFTLEEDLIFVEAAVDKMRSGVSLREVNRSKLDFQELSLAFNRDLSTVYHHWNRKMSVWLLSHYNKSLNLDIRPMLANYVADHFTDVDNIQWDKMLTQAEFKGYTETSLSSLYHGTIVNAAQNHLGVHRKHLTLRQIAENAETIYKKASVSEKVKRRQMQVINHFEKLVSERKIKNFI